MKVLVLGYEAMEGVSKKTGNAYRMGRLFVALPLGGKGGHGYQGAALDADPDILKRFDSYPCPFEAEVTETSVMRFGERRSEVVDVVPLSAA